MPFPALPGYDTTESGLLVPSGMQATSHFGAVTNTETPDPWLVDWVSGGRASAGVRVSPTTSMALAAYYACLNIIAQDCAKLPLQVLKRTKSGREKAEDHDLWPILMEEFNEDMTAYVGRETMSHHAPGWGNAYGYIERDRSMRRTEGEVVGIYPIHPARVTVERNDRTGELEYHIYEGYSASERDEIPAIIPARDMLHIKGLSPDGILGYSVAQIARESLGLSLAAQEFGASFYGNGATPTGILTHPQKLSQQAKEALTAQWHKRPKGATAVLEEGFTWQQITIPPEQAQFLVTRQFQVLEICRWFRMQPHKVQDLTNAHHTNIESQNIEHVVDTMMPWHVRWEQEINRKLLRGTEYYAKHDVRALLRGDSQMRAEYYHKMFMVGAYSPNNILELEDMNGYEGGDERFLQSQYAPVRKIADGTAQRARQAPTTVSRRAPIAPDSPEARVNGHHKLVEALMSSEGDD